MDVLPAQASSVPCERLVEVSSEDIKELNEITDQKQYIVLALSGYKQGKDS